jgi:hypothetical protein
MISNDFTKLKLKEFIYNPSGKYSSYLANRKIIVENLQSKFLQLLKDNNGKFPLKIYITGNNNYIFHIKIPSERKNLKKPLFYDTIFEFYLPTEENEKVYSSLLAYNIRFWSNSPAFTFTYMYTANKYGLIPAWIINKSSNDALKKAPTVKNPVEIIGYEKSLNFAGQYIIEKGYEKISNIKSSLKKFNLKEILSEIKSSDEKLNEYNSNKLVAKRSNKKVKKVSSDNSSGIKKLTKKLVKALTVRSSTKKITVKKVKKVKIR